MSVSDYELMLDNFLLKSSVLSINLHLKNSVSFHYKQINNFKVPKGNFDPKPVKIILVPTLIPV